MLYLNLSTFVASFASQSKFCDICLVELLAVQLLKDTTPQSEKQHDLKFHLKLKKETNDFYCTKVSEVEQIHEKSTSRRQTSRRFTSLADITDMTHTDNGQRNNGNFNR